MGRPLGPTGIGEALDRLEAAYKRWDRMWLPQKETKAEHERARKDLEDVEEVNKCARAAICRRLVGNVARGEYVECLEGAGFKNSAP